MCRNWIGGIPCKECICTILGPGAWGSSFSRATSIRGTTWSRISKLRIFHESLVGPFYTYTCTHHLEQDFCQSFKWFFGSPPYLIWNIYPTICLWFLSFSTITVRERAVQTETRCRFSRVHWVTGNPDSLAAVSARVCFSDVPLVWT